MVIWYYELKEWMFIVVNTLLGLEFLGLSEYLKMIARCKSASANLTLGMGYAPSPQRKRQAIVALFAPGRSLQTSPKTGLLSQSYFCFLISKLFDLELKINLKRKNKNETI
jgi:hypothetical protein